MPSEFLQVFRDQSADVVQAGQDTDDTSVWWRLRQSTSKVLFGLTRRNGSSRLQLPRSKDELDMWHVKGMGWVVAKLHEFDSDVLFPMAEQGWGTINFRTENGLEVSLMEVTLRGPAYVSGELRHGGFAVPVEIDSTSYHVVQHWAAAQLVGSAW